MIGCRNGKNEVRTWRTAAQRRVLPGAAGPARGLAKKCLVQSRPARSVPCGSGLPGWIHLVGEGEAASSPSLRLAPGWVDLRGGV